MLQALDIYWFCAEGLPKGRYPRGRYTAEDWLKELRGRLEATAATADRAAQDSFGLRTLG